MARGNIVAILFLCILVVHAASKFLNRTIPCIEDVASPDMLRNTSMTLYAKQAAYFTTYNAPNCTQLRQWWDVKPGRVFVFSFIYPKPRNATMPRWCGLVCSDGTTATGVVDGAFDDVWATVAGGNRSCWVNVSLQLSHDAVCTASMQYNATDYDNATVYAMPRNSTVVLDPSIALVPLDESVALEFWLELDACPWYYSVSNLSAPSVTDYSSPAIYSLLMYVNGTIESLSSTAYCVTAPNPHHNGTLQAKLVMTSQPTHAKPHYTRQPLTIPYAWFMYFTQLDSFTVSHSPQLQRIATMHPNASSWSPVFNYSDPLYGYSLERCYHVDPKGLDGTLGIIPQLRILCNTLGQAELEVRDHATTVCCVVTPPWSTSYVWINGVQVIVDNMLWIDDQSTVAGGSTATLKPSNNSTPTTPVPSSNHSSHDASRASTESTVSGSSNTIVDEDEGTALLLGLILVSICAVVALMAVLYYVLRRPRGTPHDTLTRLGASFDLPSKDPLLEELINPLVEETTSQPEVLRDGDEWEL